MVVTNINSAELIKHASNSFLAAKISFINAVSQICDKLGADILKVAEGMGYDKRIGKAFVRISERSGYDFRLLKEVRKVNEEQKASFVGLIEDKLWIIKGKTIGILGLAFKPDTDDMRCAPSVDIIHALQQEGAKIRAYDPVAMPNARKILKKVMYGKDPYETARGCDCLLVLTEWNEFRKLNFKRIAAAMKQQVLFDGRNLYHDKDLEALGFEYHGIGRGLNGAH